MQFYSLTDRGMLREINEDYCLSEKTGDCTVLILADGMGGHNGGETASKMAGEMILSYLKTKLTKNLLPGQIMLMLSEAMDGANKHIIAMAEKNPELIGMGTTVDVCIVTDSAAYIAHIGDSRVYKITPDGNITRLTKDHSLVEYMIDTGAITPEEAIDHPQRNVITKALGISSDADADILRVKLQSKDRILMCSDGLTNMVDEAVIAKTAASEDSPEDAAKKLIQLANDAGGNDNITVIIAQL